MLYIDDAAQVMRGGNASVYRAYDDGKLSTVMLKISNAKDSSRMQGLHTDATEAGCLSCDSMLERERDVLAHLAMEGCSQVPKAYALRRVYAPNRERIHERFCLEMQYLQGRTLGEALSNRGKHLSEFQAAYLACEVMRAAAQVQRCGVLHRDIHPGNVFLAEGGVYLIDFGTACFAESAREDVLCLTSGYEPPEARSGSGWSMASDVYAVAKTVAYARWGRLMECPDELPHTPLGRWAVRCMQADPLQRFSSCAEAVLSLERDLERHPLLRWSCSPLLRNAMKWGMVAEHCGIARCAASENDAFHCDDRGAFRSDRSFCAEHATIRN